MAHRGRLNVLAHTVGRPYEAILVEFEGEANPDADTAQPEGGTGDVKYHHGATGTYMVRSRARASRSRCRRTRATSSSSTRSSRAARAPTRPAARAARLHARPDARRAGAAARRRRVPGPGRRRRDAEHAEPQGLHDRRHDPPDHEQPARLHDRPVATRARRATPRTSAKGFDVPIIHVNADDVEACIAADPAVRSPSARSSAATPSSTWSATAASATTRPTSPPTRSRRCTSGSRSTRRSASSTRTSSIEEGVVTRRGGRARWRPRRLQRRAKAHDGAEGGDGRQADDDDERELDRIRQPRAAAPRVNADTLRALNEQLLQRARGLHRPPQAEAAARAPAQGARRGRGIDWAQAEALAWGSLLQQGVPIRLTGQDSERGTFSQRHLKLHDPETGQRLRADAEPRRTPRRRSSCTTRRCPRPPASASSTATRAQAPEALVLWEAQFGDFVNGAQVIIDQFIVSGARQVGPDDAPHAAAPARLRGRRPRALVRPPRALPAARRRGQHPRRQLLDAGAVLPPAAPPGADPEAPPAGRDDAEEPAAPARRGVALVAPDRGPLLPRARRPDAAGLARRGHPARALLRQGLLRHHRRTRSAPSCDNVAVGRVELLYPFAENELRELMATLPEPETVVWAQEEPKNMGARDRHGAAARLDPAGVGGATSTSAASSAPARARATPRRTVPSRRGSCARRSACAEQIRPPRPCLFALAHAISQRDSACSRVRVTLLASASASCSPSWPRTTRAPRPTAPGSPASATTPTLRAGRTVQDVGRRVHEDRRRR